MSLNEADAEKFHPLGQPCPGGGSAAQTPIDTARERGRDAGSVTGPWVKRGKLQAPAWVGVDTPFIFAATSF